MLHYLATSTPAIPLIAMIIAGVLGNKLYDRGIVPSMGAFGIVGLLLVGSIAVNGIALTSSKWLLIASLSVTFASMAFALTAGRDRSAPGGALR